MFLYGLTSRLTRRKVSVPAHIWICCRYPDIWHTGASLPPTLPCSLLPPAGCCSLLLPCFSSRQSNSWCTGAISALSSTYSVLNYPGINTFHSPKKGGFFHNFSLPSSLHTHPFSTQTWVSTGRWTGNKEEAEEDANGQTQYELLNHNICAPSSVPYIDIVAITQHRRVVTGYSSQPGPCGLTENQRTCCWHGALPSHRERFRGDIFLAWHSFHGALYVTLS